MIYYKTVVLHGRSYFLFTKSDRKRKKLKEIKEIKTIQIEWAIRKAEIIEEFDNLKERAHEYKIMQLKDTRYKEIVDNLI